MYMGLFGTSSFNILSYKFDATKAYIIIGPFGTM